MSSFHVNVKHVEMALQAFGFEYERAGNFTVNRRIREMSSRAKKNKIKKQDSIFASQLHVKFSNLMVKFG